MRIKRFRYDPFETRLAIEVWSDEFKFPKVAKKRSLRTPCGLCGALLVPGLPPNSKRRRKKRQVGVPILSFTVAVKHEEEAAAGPQGGNEKDDRQGVAGVVRSDGL